MKTFAVNKLQNLIAGLDHGFLKREDFGKLANLDRLFPVLVRTNLGRFTCAVQCVEHFIRCVEAGGDYVRDVSVPVGSNERAAAWVEYCPVTPIDSFPQSFLERKPSVPRRVRHFEDEEYRGDADSGL